MKDHDDYDAINYRAEKRYTILERRWIVIITVVITLNYANITRGEGEEKISCRRHFWHSTHDHHHSRHHLAIIRTKFVSTSHLLPSHKEKRSRRKTCQLPKVIWGDMIIDLNSISMGQVSVRESDMMMSVPGEQKKSRWSKNKWKDGEVSSSVVLYRYHMSGERERERPEAKERGEDANSLITSRRFAYSFQ